jgi:proteic killer suppression protein
MLPGAAIDRRGGSIWRGRSEALAAWKAHTLTGDRKGTWSLSVTRNRRLTFRIDTVEREVFDVNLEAYH